MKIVKPYGLSATDKKGERYLRARLLKRNEAGETQIPETAFKEHEFGEFNQSDPRILIGQWISIIDKIIRKPNQKDFQPKGMCDRTNSPTNNDVRRRAQVKFRTELGRACWNLLEERKLLDRKALDDFAPIWAQKLHPAGDVPEEFQSDRQKKNERGKKIWEDNKPVWDDEYILNITGLWYVRFMGEDTKLDNEEQLDQLEFDNIAADIFKHLHEKEFKKHDGEKSIGLIEARAISVANSSPKKHMEKMWVEGEGTKLLESLTQEKIMLPWTDVDEKSFINGKRVHSLAEQISATNAHLEDQKQRLHYDIVGGYIFEHYRKQFIDKDGAVPKRVDIAKERFGLLALYDEVRSLYKGLIKNSNKKSLKRTLPANDKELFTLLRQRHANKITNNLIRLGKILHYEGTVGDGDGFGLSLNKSGNIKQGGQDIFALNLKDIANSAYWKSDGQADIKRTEAFVRIWRNTISQAQRTAQTLADPDGKFSKALGRPLDVLEDKVSPMLSTDDKVMGRANNNAKLLFGVQAKLFEDVDPSDFIYGTLRLLANIRNKAFHFNGRRAFVQKMISGFDEDNIKNIVTHEKTVDLDGFWTQVKALLASDQMERFKRQISVLEGAQFNCFATTNQINNYLKLLSHNESDVSLPRFNKLLTRIDNTTQKISRTNNWFFPEPASHVDLNAFPAMLTKFVGLKILYEGPFRAWVHKIKPEKLAEYRNAAADLGSKAAKKINSQSKYPELIRAKTEDLPLISKIDTISSYMDTLQAFQASEQRLQKGYESNSSAAKEQAEWIENFRKDILARAFRDYLNEHFSQLKWLLELKKADAPREPQAMPKAGSATDGETLSESWHAALYYILHLVPAYEVSRLLHQIRKWGILEKKSGATDEPDTDVENLRRLLILYIEMSEDKHTGEGIALEGMDKFYDMFKDKQTGFDKVFKTEGSTEDVLASTRRGLREILRYGNKNVLTVAIGEVKVTDNDITAYRDQQAGIERAQLKRKKIHSELIKRAGDKNQQFVEYVTALKSIISYRELSHRVNLTNFVKLHKIMLQVVARLIDYAGVWERDGYFIATALMKIHGKKPEDVLGDGAPWFRSAGKLPRTESMDITFLGQLSRFYTPQLTQIRKDLHHFNLVAGDDVDLTGAVNNVRRLMAYDRKMKNAVSKSIKEMMDEEGLFLCWKMDASHNLALDPECIRNGQKVPAIESRVIKHLQKGWRPKRESYAARQKDNQALSENFHDDNFVRAVTCLFSPNRSTSSPV